VWWYYSRRKWKKQPLFVEPDFLLFCRVSCAIMGKTTKGGHVMAEYELVHEIQNLCRNNQMRDIFFEEVETDDPVAYVRQLLKGKAIELTTDTRADGGITVYASVDGLTQKFIFTPI
jgi:predicted MarR family transcription regulator